MKKILTTLICAAAALLFAANTNAQSQWGFGGGFILNSFSGADKALVVNDASRPGFYLGIDRNWAFSSLEGLSLDPGVNFVYVSKDKKPTPYIQIPVHIKYTTEMAPDFLAALYTGPVFNLGLTANGFTRDEFFPLAKMKKWNAQWAIGAEFTYSESIALKVSYNLGMSRAFYVKEASDPNIRQNSFQIGLVFRVFE